jgi:hypothetical protein
VSIFCVFFAFILLTRPCVAYLFLRPSWLSILLFHACFKCCLNILISKVEKQKDSIPESNDKNSKKKMERLEEQLKTNNRELSMVKMKSMMLISFLFMSLLSMFNSMYVYLRSRCRFLP